jgi:hypothetical protein
MNSELYNNIKRNFSQEQLDEYKKIGEYMYNNVDYKVASQGLNITQPKENDILSYAIQGLKSGLNPDDLTDKEVEILVKTYGDKWYEKFNIDASEVVDRSKNVQMQIIDDVRKKTSQMNLSRQQKRMIERRIKKMETQK